jgi:4-hydroxybenzoate polyprenyltransferase
MRLIANAIRFVVYSNIFIALCALAYTAKTSLLLFGNNGNLHVNLTGFSAILLFYCFHRINKKKFLTSGENEESRNDWMSSHRNTYYVLLTASSVTLFVQLFYMPARTWLVFIPVGFLGIGYTFPIIYTGKDWKRLRDIAWLKPFWIAFAFSWLTTFLPVVFAEPVSNMFNAAVLFIFSRSFLFVFALCIPFDIRDMNFDKLKGVYTVPVSAGAKTSIYIAICLLLIFISLVCIQFLYFKLDFSSAIALFCSSTLTILLLPLANTQRPALFFPLLFDSAMLVQWILIVAFLYINIS